MSKPLKVVWRLAKTVKLNSGYECPILGYGTFQSTNPEQLKAGLKAAIAAGYRHIDTAQIYGNESVIGETLNELFAEGKVKREDLYITTKVFGFFFRPDLLIPQLKKQLADLRTNYVDLYLLHFPVALQMPGPGEMFKMGPDGKIALDNETKLEDTWKAMEECVKLGLTRSIGVSNFNIKQVERLLASEIKPAMNQIELHPVFQNAKLVEFCQSHGVAITAYSQFGSPGTINRMTGKVFIDVPILEDPRIVGIGAKYNKTPSQVILRWLIQSNIVAIPKSVTPSRIDENFNVWDFELNAEDLATIKSMDLNKRFSTLPVPGITEHAEYPHHEEGSC